MLTLPAVDIPTDEEIDEFSLGLPAIKAELNRLPYLLGDLHHSAHYRPLLTQKSCNNPNESLCVMLVEKRFPCARKSLCSQLGASINVRGMLLQYKQDRNRNLAYQGSDKNNLWAIDERPEEEITAPAVASVNKDMAPIEEMIAQDPKTFRFMVSAAAVDRIKQNTRYPSTTATTMGSTVRDGQLNEYDYPPKPRRNTVERHHSCTICAMPLDLLALTDSAWEYATIPLYQLWEMF